METAFLNLFPVEFYHGVTLNSKILRKNLSKNQVSKKYFKNLGISENNIENMLQLDKKTVSEFESAGVTKLKVFFIEAGCSGTKIEMQTEFEMSDDLVEIPHPNPLLTKERETSKVSGRGFKIYVPKTDKKYLENAKITRVVVADHTGVEKIRYIFTSSEVEDRCGCGSSFAFEKSVPKIDLEKLKTLKNTFNNKIN